VKQQMSQNHIEKTFLAAILCIGIFLFFTNLGNIYLWQDEAQTALISQTVLHDGVPRGYDGKNYFSQELGSEYGENYIFKWHTWLPFYITAAFLKIFGNNAFAARLPFALFGLGSVFFLYYLTKSLFNNKRAASMAALVLLVSIPFLLLSRQCRYYSMTAFFPHDHVWLPWGR
jgi:4-amino-4-deoxy-L-arabinose transferase-like glycosyltransferase